MLGTVHGFVPEKLIIPMLAAPEVAIDAVADQLEIEFGDIDYRSDPIRFDYTRYYEREMGSELTRYFFAFKELVSPDLLAGIKQTTNLIERRHADEEARTVNLDPGLLSLERFVLASTKDNGRRIPLRDGIYAEITLIYHHGDFHPVEWTYPDFASREYRDLLEALRERYRTQLKQHNR